MQIRIYQSRVLKSLLKQCINDRCPQISASLAYATLLALIPITVFTYKLYSAVSIEHSWQVKIQALVFESLTPDTAEQVQKYLFESAVNASSINILGIFMLIVSVLIMMNTIDNALNMIWKINKPRHLLHRIVIYLTLLIFGPLAIFFSLFVSAYIASLPMVSGIVGSMMEAGISNWLPFLVLWAAFTMLYKWVPYCEVRWLHAFSGATIAVCLLEVAKSAFTLYVSYVHTYEHLYGALAAIPLLLIWIYLTWLIVLIGAEIAHYMQIAE
jgi:membrane protein